METVNKKIDELSFAEYNPRKISEKDMKNLVKSLDKFGLVEPIVVNKDMTIIGGHQRVRAAQELGIVEVPCVIVDLDKESEKKLNLSLNKIQGEWDNEKLSELLHGFDDIELTGFTDIEMKFIEDISGFGSGGQLSEEDYQKFEDEKGIMTNEANRLSFYVQKPNVFQLLHDYFGGTQDHDVKKLVKLVELGKANGIE